MSAFLLTCTVEVYLLTNSSVRPCACVRARVRVCVCVCARARACVRACVFLCVRFGSAKNTNSRGFMNTFLLILYSAVSAWRSDSQRGYRLDSYYYYYCY